MNITIRPVSTISSREFNQDTAGAKKAAERGPVFITTRGEPTHVLMTKAQYDRIEAGKAKPEPFISIAEALADKRPEADFDFEFPEFKGKFRGFEFD